MDLRHTETEIPNLFNQQNFYNTIELAGEEKHRAEVSALKGNTAVYAIFTENPDCHFTPRQIHLMLLGKGFSYELTSVRRGITDLTKAGKLLKNHKEYQRVESKGTKNFTWKLNTEK